MNLKDKTLTLLLYEVIQEGKWQAAENAMICGKNLVRHIERVSKDVLRDSKGNRKSDKESW